MNISSLDAYHSYKLLDAVQQKATQNTKEAINSQKASSAKKPGKEPISNRNAFDAFVASRETVSSYRSFDTMAPNRDNILLLENPLTRYNKEKLDGLKDAFWNYDQLKKQLDKETELLKKTSEKENEERRKRDRRVNKLKSKVAFYKNKAIQNKNDKRSQAMLSMYQTQLYWAMYG